MEAPAPMPATAFRTVPSQVNFPALEEDILALWAESGTFEKSVSQRPAENPFIFYDGPPFASGLPHYGHLLQSIIKDVVPRYWTMRGRRVERRFGWDCHGLPVENEAEQQLADLREGMDSCLTLLRGQMPEGIDVIRDYAEVAPLHCAPGRLNQAFTVLLTNAVQVLPDGGEIVVRVFDQDHEICVQVTDNGPGISPERLETIFDVGFRATDERVKMSYGLPTAYAIVHEHDGHIDIDSSVGEGTTVTVHLPRR